MASLMLTFPVSTINELVVELKTDSETFEEIASIPSPDPSDSSLWNKASVVVSAHCLVALYSSSWKLKYDQNILKNVFTSKQL